MKGRVGFGGGCGREGFGGGCPSVSATFPSVPLSFWRVSSSLLGGVTDLCLGGLLDPFRVNPPPPRPPTTICWCRSCSIRFISFISSLIFSCTSCVAGLLENVPCIPVIAAAVFRACLIFPARVVVPSVFPNTLRARRPRAPPLRNRVPSSSRRLSIVTLNSYANTVGAPSFFKRKSFFLVCAI